MAPTKIDPKLLDSRYVFKNDDQNKKVSLNSIFKDKKNRDGYETTGLLLYKKSSIMDFINSDEPVNVLAQNTAFEFSGEEAQKYLTIPLLLYDFDLYFSGSSTTQAQTLLLKLLVRT